MRDSATHSIALLTLFAVVSVAPTSARADAGPRDYQGPGEVEPVVKPGGGAPAPKPKPEEPPPDVTPDVDDGEGGVVFVIEDASDDEGGDEGGDGFVMEDASDEGEGEGEGDEGDEGEDCDDGFCFEDLSDDEEALAAEAAVEVKTIKGPSGAIKGTLKDSTSGSPLIGATVKIPKSKYAAETNINGEYTLNAPPGTYSLEIIADGYKPTTIDNVKVEQDKETKVNDELQPFGALTVVVEGELNTESAAGKLVERKKAATAQDVMSREDISKSGGGSTSSVARRIVGSTVVGGRYLFIRGLGHRYGNTLFDGARVPSPDPNIRTVPLDIFPTSALGAINIQKTAMPDVPADFTGGSTQLETRNTPDELSWELGADIGVNTETTFQNALRGDAFFGDNLAFGNLARQLGPAYSTAQKIDAAEQDANLNNIYSNEQIRDFGRGLPSTNTAVYPTMAPPNWGVKGMIGDTVHPWGTDLGVLATLSYDNSVQSLRPDVVEVWGSTCPDGTIQPGAGSCPPAASVTTTYRNNLLTTKNVKWSGLFLLKWRLSDNHRLSLSTMYTRDADNEARRLGNYQGESFVRSLGTQPVTNTRLRYQMRSILFTRLGGKHEFPAAKDLTLDWFGSFAQARQDDPLLREMLFFRTESAGIAEGDRTSRPEVYKIEPNDSSRFQWMNTLDNTGTGSVNLTLPFQQWSKLDSRFKFGAWAEGKDRQFTSRTFKWRVPGGVEPPLGTGNIFNDETIGGPTDPDATFYLRETTRDVDSYNARQRLLAGYAMLELPFTRWFKIAGGVRFEGSDIQLDQYSPFTNQVTQAEVARVVDNDPLPSVALIFPVRSDMNVRLAGYETVARPEFRELAPFIFTDFVGGIDVQGDPNLVSTKIWNADLRYEWFPSANEVLAVSGFFKYFEDPIEAFIQNGPTLRQSYQNARGALNGGAELELRKNLEFIAKPLRDLSIGANFAYIYSRVQIRFDVSDTLANSNADRPLQGQSPYIFNAFISYDNDKSGTNLRVLFNTFGRRIYAVGAGGLDDIYLLPIHTLDFVAEQRLYKGLHLDFKAANMLNWKEERVQWHGTSDERVLYRVRRGVSFSLGLSYKF
ncbi:MAG: carboxypeptidase regulatory-like domain-containing protein [Myxococcales bacterium]|nr:carboxypeptidase regulatory-like domain-containing protein [Myxococcales bacterium]